MLDTYAFLCLLIDWTGSHYLFTLGIVCVFGKGGFSISTSTSSPTLLSIAFTNVVSLIIFDSALASIFPSSPSQLACDLTFSPLRRSLFAFFVLARQYTYSITLGQVRCGYFFSWILYLLRLCYLRRVLKTSPTKRTNKRRRSRHSRHRRCWRPWHCRLF